MAELVPEPGVDAEADPVAEEEPEGGTVAVADADALAVGLVSQLALDDADGVAVADAEALTVQPTPMKIPTISTVEPSSTRCRATWAPRCPWWPRSIAPRWSASAPSPCPWYGRC